MAVLTQADKKWIEEKEKLENDKFVKLSVISEIRQSTPIVYCNRLQYYVDYYWDKSYNWSD